MGGTVRMWMALVVAAALEVGGDYLVRRGRLEPDARVGWTALGMTLLASYGVAVTYWWDGTFGKLLGVYVAVFFVVSQVWGALVEREDVLTTPRLVGGALIVVGGALIQWWQPR